MAVLGVAPRRGPPVAPAKMNSPAATGPLRRLNTSGSRKSRRAFGTSASYTRSRNYRSEAENLATPRQAIRHGAVTHVSGPDEGQVAEGVGLPCSSKSKGIGWLTGLNRATDIIELFCALANRHGPPDPGMRTAAPAGPRNGGNDLTEAGNLNPRKDSTLAARAMVPVVKGRAG